MRAWVISGGGARIIQAQYLIEKHLSEGGKLPDLIVGTSAGGLLACLISHLGIAGSREEILRIKNRKSVFSGNFLWGLGKTGLWNCGPLQKLLERVVPRSPRIKYFVCSYDIEKHKTVYLPKENGWFWLASTACIPLLVEPVGPLVDGGLCENTPLRFPIDQGATEVEVFMCSAEEAPSEFIPGNKISMALRCLEAQRLEIARNDVKVCRVKNGVTGYREVKVTMHVPKFNAVGILDFDKMREGYRALGSQK